VAKPARFKAQNIILENYSHHSKAKALDSNNQWSPKRELWNKIKEKKMKYSFVFICQKGELEIKAMLLAASLKRYLRGDYELVAAIPHPPSRWGTLCESTLSLMQILGVRSVPIINRINENYPIGNKVSCLSIETSADKIIFLDSDILCLQEFSIFDTGEKTRRIFEAPFSAKPADLMTFTDWQRVYDLFQLPLPKRRVLSSTSGQLMLPYFNAGVIAVQNGLKFGQVWEWCCRVIDAESSITNKRPWLDQIALPVAIQKLNVNYQCLDERFNYPAHLKPLPSSLPFLCHYHWPTVIRREPFLNQLVIELTMAFPLLKKMLLTEPQWAQLFKPYTLQPKSKKLSLVSRITQKFPVNVRSIERSKTHHHPEMMITGIPRSGTSYLCRLLHSLPDCVVINEPTQIYGPLNNNLTIWQIATYYQELRRDILDGKPVENKVHHGKVIEDTAIIDIRTQYQPPVSRPDFLLITKNTLAYMARLPQLKPVLPQAPIVACIRHPLDTIASWKTSFPHLQNATVEQFPIGHVNDPFLTQYQRQQLAEIVAQPNLALKRALLWRYLAEIVLINMHQLIVVHYEELVTQPTKVLKNLWQQIPNSPPLSKRNLKKIPPSTIRQKREVLDAQDLQAINDVCGECAVALEYKIK
jgi:hypothetical protein